MKESLRAAKFSSDDTAILGIALAATIGISAAEGAWELLETITGLILIAVLIEYVDLKELRSSRIRRRIAFSGVLALCVTLASSWLLQTLVVKDVNSAESIREFDDTWLVGTFGVGLVVVFAWLAVARHR